MLLILLDSNRSGIKPGALQTDEWAEGRRYLGLEVLARCRVNLVPNTNTNTKIGADQLPALTA